MIQIHLQMNRHSEVERIIIEGHADYAEHGKDIVCAAVSALSIGIINAIEQKFSISILSDMDESGKIDCVLPKHVQGRMRENIALLLETLAISLEQVATEYPQYVKINKKG